MEPIKRATSGHWVFLSFVLLSIGISFAQTTSEQEAKISEQARIIEERMAKLPKHEKKIHDILLAKINKMIAENASQSYRGRMKERYSSHLTQVNDEGAIQLKIELFTISRQADVDAIVDKVKKVGASDIYPHFPQPQMNWYPSIVCYIPYDQIKEIAKDDRIARIGLVVPPTTRYIPKVTEGDSQLY